MKDMVRCANQSYIVRFAHGPLAVKNRGKGKGVRGKGRWPHQNLIAVFFIKLIARKSAGKYYAQAVALLERQGPVFPAAREAVPPHGEQRVFPAPRGKRGSAALSF